MPEQDVTYYRRRADTERRLADEAEHPDTVAAHRGLASLYGERLKDLTASETMRGR